MLRTHRLFIFLIAITFGITCNAGRHITLRINNAYGPFEYIGNDGKPTGFTVDIFKAVNQLNHFNYDIKSDKDIFNFYSTVLDANQLATTMDSVPSNMQFVTSEPYGYIDNDIVTRIYSDINKWEDMNGKMILIVRDSPIIFYFKQRNVKANFVYINSVPDGLRLLSSGKYDAMISSNDAAYFYINRLKLDNLTVKPIFVQPLSLRFVMLNTPENQRLIGQIDAALQTMRSNGTYDALYSKRFYPNTDESLSTFELWLITVVVIIIMILIIYVLYIHWLYQAEKRKKLTPIENNAPFVTDLGKIYNSSPTATLFFDLNGHTTFINKAAIELLNINNVEKVIDGNHTLFDYTILSDQLINELRSGNPITVDYDIYNNSVLFQYLGNVKLPANKAYNILIVPTSNFNTPHKGYIMYLHDMTKQLILQNDNIKFITALNQITESKLLDVCYYNVKDDDFYTFTNNTALRTGMSYEKSLAYIHPLYRSLFIDEFLSILNGEKSKAQLTIKKNVSKEQKYNTYELILRAIKLSPNTVIGISLISVPIDTKQTMVIQNKELQSNMSFLLRSSGYQFMEYDPENDKYSITTIEGGHKEFNSTQIFDAIHPDDCPKAIEIMEHFKSGKITDSYIVLRFMPDKTIRYSYIELYLHSCYFDTPSRNIVLGVYHNITDQQIRLRELEEFKECTTIACEKNNMAYVEYCVDDVEHSIVPYYLTEKYDIDEDNFTELLNKESREKYDSILNKFNVRSENIGVTVLNIKTPNNDKWLSLKLIVTPVRDDIKGDIYRYMGFIEIKELN